MPSTSSLSSSVKSAAPLDAPSAEAGAPGVHRGPAASALPPARLLAVTLRTPALLLWALYILFVPVYVFKSGLPQPGDWMILLLVPVAASKWDGRLAKRPARAMRALIWFTFYVLLSSLVWTVVTGSVSMSLQQGFLITPVFYIYNALAFGLALVLHRRYGDTFLQVTAYSAIASVWIQAALSLVVASKGPRGVVLFNNPNQLGYYALLSCTILVVLQLRLRMGMVVTSLSIVAAAYLAAVSASKSALVGMAVLVALSMFNRVRAVLLVGLIAGLVVTFVAPVRDAINRSEDRIRNDSHQTFLLERGYDRVWNHPEYWLLGSGEGGYQRFALTTTVGSVELHSSAGTVFFCYGIVGSLLFIYFLVVAIAGLGWRTGFMLAPAAAYGVVHQGLRFTLLWLVLAVVTCTFGNPAKLGTAMRRKR